MVASLMNAVTHPVLAFFTLFISTGGAAARGDQAATALKQTNPIEVVVKTVEPAVARGSLVSLSWSDGLVLKSRGREQRIAASNLVRITAALPMEDLHPSGVPGDVVPGAPSAKGGASRATLGAPWSTEDDMKLTLTGGDMIHGRLGDSEGEVIAVETLNLGRVSVPLESMVALDTPRSKLPTYRDTVRWLDRTPVAMDDRILLTNGDVVRGYITLINGRNITIDNGESEVEVPFRLVVAVRFAASRKPAPDAIHGVATLRDGTRLTLTKMDWIGHRVRATWQAGAVVNLAADRIVRLDIGGGRWEWLTSHRPISTQDTPMLSLHWEPATNRNVLGGPIKVAGETFEHGIGVHSRSSLTYDLKEAYEEFATSFGIDDDSGPLADVTVVILVDGRRRLEETNIRRGKLWGPIRLNIAGAKHIELVVDFGENGGLQDRFDWVEPALIR
ncbi:MAG: NPCBM/NEW2 domain-containing protein [Planctomycetes bacterium]|nr:NPCBM/NEW2 domain-containing protein [Planctomycetota bacterium]